MLQLHLAETRPTLRLLTRTLKNSSKNIQKCNFFVKWAKKLILGMIFIALLGGIR